MESTQQTLPFGSETTQDAETPGPRLRRSGPPEAVAALDLGSSKITCLIAVAEDNLIKVRSIVTVPSRGIERGDVVALDDASNAAAEAIAKAQAIADVECGRYFVGIAGRHCQGHHSRGSVTVAKENHVITRKNVAQALAAARNISLPSDRRIIDSVPQSFSVDNSSGIRDPIGMTGNRLDAEMYLASESVNSIRNVTTCLQRIGCRHEGLLFEPFATAEAVLTADEKDLGTVQIDIGEGTTDIAVYYAGSPRLARVLPVGGGHIARDVAVGLATTVAAARKLVHDHGAACEAMLDPARAKQEIQAPTPDTEETHTCHLRKLCYIIECRVDEILEIAKKEVQRAGLNGHASRVVLTGGTASLRGIARKAEQVFGSPARIGRPKIYTDHPELRDDPAFATAVGLLVYGVKMRRMIEQKQRHPIVSVAARSIGWLREFF
ncbi:MAG: cell division protein FtsA [Planctomycetes bacterium]|nr:cell division protein FtsA [Planctomycetota bacterium]